MDAKTILIVDDSKDFIILLSSLLKFHKIQVDAVADSFAALKLCNEKKYALIISDYLMEDQNGLEFAEKVRMDTLNKDVPMILITAKDLETSELAILNRLALTYIKKPVMPNEMYRKITDILGRSSQ